MVHTVTSQKHFTRCNHVKCKSVFLIDPNEQPGDLGFLCPQCSAKTISHHVIQCASCGTVINFVRAADKEPKHVFTIEKCSHCIGSIEDEWAIEPIYQSDSYM